MHIGAQAWNVPLPNPNLFLPLEPGFKGLGQEVWFYLIFLLITFNNVKISDSKKILISQFFKTNFETITLSLKASRILISHQKLLS